MSVLKFEKEKQTRTNMVYSRFNDGDFKNLKMIKWKTGKWNERMKILNGYHTDIVKKNSHFEYNEMRKKIEDFNML